MELYMEKKTKYTARKSIYFCQIVKMSKKEKENLVFLRNDLDKRREINAKASDELIFQVPLPKETCKKIKKAQSKVW